MIWGQTTALISFFDEPPQCSVLPPPAYFLCKAHHSLLDLTTNTTKHLLHYTWGPFKTAKSPRKAKNVENITRKRPQRGCLFSLWELKHKAEEVFLTQLRTQLGKYLETDFGLTNIFKMIKWVHKYRIYEWRLYLRINVTAFCQCQIKCH